MWGLLSWLGFGAMAAHESYQINNPNSKANRDTRASLERIGYYDNRRADVWKREFEAEVKEKEGALTYEAIHFMRMVFEYMSRGGSFDTAYQKYLPEYEKALIEREETKKWRESLSVKPPVIEKKQDDIDKKLVEAVSSMSEEEKLKLIQVLEASK